MNHLFCLGSLTSRDDSLRSPWCVSNQETVGGTLPGITLACPLVNQEMITFLTKELGLRMDHVMAAQSSDSQLPSAPNHCGSLRNHIIKSFFGKEDTLRRWEGGPRHLPFKPAYQAICPQDQLWSTLVSYSHNAPFSVNHWVPRRKSLHEEQCKQGNRQEYRTLAVILLGWFIMG